jgi:hypothetical protein
MPTAPSFSSFCFLSEPFLKNNKYYIKVQNPKTLTERTVRWYSDSEYSKLYGEKPSVFKNLKQARGFSKGPIYLFQNFNTSDKPHPSARYSVETGWYIASTDSIPANLSLTPLPWEEFLSRNPKFSCKN